MPVLPGITDRPSALRALVRTVAAAGASHVNMCALRLGATARRRYLPFIDAEFPHLVARYRRAYAERDLMNDAYREELRRVVREACHSAGISYGTPEETGTGSDGTARAGGAWTPGRDESPAATHPDIQMELTL
jgi:DNA repair photolyase